MVMINIRIRLEKWWRDFLAVLTTGKIIILAALIAIPIAIASNSLFIGLNLSANFSLIESTMRFVTWIICSLLVLILFSFIRDAVSIYAGMSSGAVLCALILAAFSIFVSGGNVSSIEGLQGAGVTFVVVMSIVTILGFVITISKLTEYQGHIRDYSSFLIRLDRFLERLIEDADHVSDSKKIELIILCSVPSLGNLSVQKYFYPKVYVKMCRVIAHNRIDITISSLGFGESEKSWAQIHPPGYLSDSYKSAPRDYDPLELWDDITDSQRTRAIDNLLGPSTDESLVPDCENDPSLRSGSVILPPGGPMGKFYRDLEANHNFTSTEVRRGFAQALDIMHRITIHNRKFIPYNSYQLSQPEPSCHLFITSSRALIAIPVNRDIHQAKTSRDSVYLVGYETADLEAIKRFRDTFNNWEQYIKNSSNNASSVAAESNTTNPAPEPNH